MKVDTIYIEDINLSGLNIIIYLLLIDISKVCNIFIYLFTFLS